MVTVGFTNRFYIEFNIMGVIMVEKVISWSFSQVLIVLFVFNLLLWNNSLPFINYGNDISNLILWSKDSLPYIGNSIGLTKIVILQGIHTILNMVEIWVLLEVGQQYKKLSKPTGWIIQNWLLVVFVGSLSLLGGLLRGKHFQFSDLITVFFPILRGASNIVIALLITPFIIFLTKELTSEIKTKINWVIELLFLTQTIFNVNLWGISGQDTALIYVLIILLGANLHECTGSKKVPITILGVGFILALGMPLFSSLAHWNLSTATRFSSLGNGFVIVGLTELYRKIKFRLSLKLSNLIVPLSIISTLPIVSTYWTKLITNFPGDLILRFEYVLICAIGITIITYVVGLGWKYIILNTDLKNFSEVQFPTTFDEAKSAIKKYIVKYQRQLFALFTIYCVAYLSFVGVLTTFKASMLVMIFVRLQGMIIVNAFFLWLIYRGLLAITNRYWVSLIISLFAEIFWTIANQIKIEVRNDPILPAEVKMFQAYGDVFKMVPNGVLIIAILLIFALVFGIFYLERKHQVKIEQRPLKRLIVIVIISLIFGSSCFWNHPGNRIGMLLKAFGNDPAFYDQLEGVQNSGPLVQLLNNIDVTIMNRPKDYNRATMEKVAKHYRQEAKKINKQRTNELHKQSIIFNLSESFSDPRRVPNILISKNPIKRIDAIKSQTTSGLMLSSGYGGGTANMEYMTLTGLPVASFMPMLTIPYTQLVPGMSYSWSFNQLFKTSTAIHPYEGTFYSRISVYKKFKFNKFMYLGSKYKIKHQKKLDRSPYLSDQTAYENTLDQLKLHPNGQFINLISMQNHFPFDRNYYDLPSEYKIKITNQTSVSQLKDYVGGIHHTDQEVKQFITKLDQLKQPVTVVFYGDHLPGIYANSFAKDGEKLHETDYFIYSNKAAREQGAKNLTRDTKFVAPNEFMAMVAEQTNSKVTPYLAFLTDAWHDLPVEVMNMTGEQSNSYAPHPQFVTRQGKIISQKHFTKKQKQLYHDYQLIQYDLTAGKQYLVKDWKMK